MSLATLTGQIVDPEMKSGIRDKLKVHHAHTYHLHHLVHQMW